MAVFVCLAFFLWVYSEVSALTPSAELYIKLGYVNNWRGTDKEHNYCHPRICKIDVQLCIKVDYEEWSQNDKRWNKTCDSDSDHHAITVDLGLQSFSQIGWGWRIDWRDKTQISDYDSNNGRVIFNPIREPIPNFPNLGTQKFDKGAVHMQVRLDHVFNITNELGESIEERVEVDIFRDVVPLNLLRLDMYTTWRNLHGYERPDQERYIHFRFAYGMYMRCAAGYYGCDCDKFCMPDERHQCDPETGQKICRQHWYPKTEEEGDRCIHFCRPHYRMYCDKDGNSVCADGYCRKTKNAPNHDNPCIPITCDPICYTGCTEKDCPKLVPAPQCKDGYHCEPKSSQQPNGYWYTCEKKENV